MDTGSCPSTDERVRLFGLLLETNARLTRRFGSALEAECGLPLAWFEVLLQLRRAPAGRLTMSQIAEGAVYSSGGTTRLVDRIEAAGLVARSSCPNDRRAVHVSITAAGNARLDDALTAHVGHLEAGMAERLDVRDRATLAGLLEKLNAD
jgi:DNA-binding MarR family transcriptional regulator